MICHKFDIHISEDILHKYACLLLGLTLLFTIIGMIVSPCDQEGKPVLLLPEVKALEDYRRSSQRWLRELSFLDGEITNMLSATPNGDLFSQSKGAQNMLQHAFQLVQQVDRTHVPTLWMGFQDQMLSISMSYLETARSTLRWVSLPEKSNLELAIQQLADSRKLKTDLESNPWMIAH